MSFVWIAALVAFGILEAATVNMVSLWFMGGALAALIAQLLGAGIWVQVALFFVVSVVLLACLRPFVKKFINPRKTATNLDTAIGRQAVLTETVDNLRGTGALKLEGKEWSVRSASGEVLEKGSLVRVVEIKGVKLCVEPAEAAVQA